MDYTSDLTPKTNSEPFLCNEQIIRKWDGQKVWVLVEDMWRQGTVIACVPPARADEQWGFVVQSKHESNRHLVFANLVENSSDFDNIEATEYIDLPNPVQLTQAQFDALPDGSTEINVGTQRCPVHPFVADYIKRLLHQIQQASSSTQKEALIAADAEVSRLRIALQTAAEKYQSKYNEYDAFINDLLADLNATRIQLNSAPSGIEGTNLQILVNSLQADNRRMIEENRVLRSQIDDLSASKAARLPSHKELEQLHSELVRLKEVVAAGGFSSAPIGTGDGSTASVAAIFERLEQDNRNLLEAQMTTAGNLRLAGIRMNQLSARITKYESMAIEYRRPAFDFENAQDTALMMNKLLAEGARLVERLNILETSLARKFVGSPPQSPMPADGSLASMVEEFRLTVLYLEARVDHFTGSSDPQSISYGRLQELELEKEQLQKLLATADSDLAATNSYLDSAIQPVLNENAMLKQQLKDAMRRCAGLQEALTKKEKSGFLW